MDNLIPSYRDKHSNEGNDDDSTLNAESVVAQGHQSLASYNGRNHSEAYDAGYVQDNGKNVGVVPI